MFPLQKCTPLIVAFVVWTLAAISCRPTIFISFLREYQLGISPFGGSGFSWLCFHCCQLRKNGDFTPFMKLAVRTAHILLWFLITGSWASEEFCILFSNVLQLESVRPGGLATYDFMEWLNCQSSWYSKALLYPCLVAIYFCVKLIQHLCNYGVGKAVHVWSVHSFNEWLKRIIALLNLAYQCCILLLNRVACSQNQSESWLPLV